MNSLAPIGFNRTAAIPPQTAGEGTGATQLSARFGDFLNEAMNSIHTQSAEVQQLNYQFITGQSTDAHSVRIAAEKAAIQLEMTVQFRNKAIEAYQEIMRIQI